MRIWGGLLFYRYMKNYTKPALTYQSQLDLLRNRGLIVTNETKALHLLENLSYYRLSAYFYPLLEGDKKLHQFKPGSTFDMAFNMYCFDRELRLLILGDIEKIEVALRAKLTYVMSHKYGAFWYTYEKLFKKKDKFYESLNVIRSLSNDSSANFVKEYKANYVNTDLPSWMALELSTFTFLSKTYGNLIDNVARNEIAQYFGIGHHTPLENWLLFLSNVRNICAHHSRFWNAEIGIKALKPDEDKVIYDFINMHAVSKCKAYFAISIIMYFLKRVNPNSSLKNKLVDLFERYPSIDITAMDFPTDWQDQPLWKS